MIVHDDSQRFAGLGNLAGQFDILPARRGIAAGMVVERPTQFNMMLILKCFFDALTELVPVIGIGFCDRP
jgi:hypothetical protein